MADIRALLGLGLAAAVAACSPETVEPSVTAETVHRSGEPTAGVSVGYACESGETVEVRYDSAQLAELTYKGEVHTLRTAVSASGARYAGPDLEWWTRSRGGREEAVLSRIGASEIGGSVLERCMRPATSRAELPLLESKVDSAPPCQGPALTLALESDDASAGSRRHTLALTNAGATPCLLQGYPEVQLLDAAGARLSAIRTEQARGSQLAEGETPSPVEVAAGERAYFDILSSAVPAAGQESCPQARRVRVTAPGDTSAVHVDLRLQPCGGRVRVTPVRAAAGD